MTLSVKSLDAGYGKLAILHEVSLEVAAGSIWLWSGSPGRVHCALCRRVVGGFSPS